MGIVGPCHLVCTGLLNFEVNRLQMWKRTCKVRRMTAVVRRRGEGTIRASMVVNMSAAVRYEAV